MLRHIRQGYRSWAKIGSVYVMCRPGAGVSEPRNFDVPYPLNNSEGELNVTEGLHYPQVNMPIIPVADYFTLTNIENWFHKRGTNTALATYDDLTAYDITIQDSLQPSSTANFGQRKIYKCKGAGYTLSFSKGEPLGFNARFGGTQSTMLTTAETMPDNNRITSPGLNFSAISFGEGLAGAGIIGGSLEIDVGLSPNPELDYESGDTIPAGTAATAGDNVGLFPKELNAGLLSASLTLQTNAGEPLADDTAGEILIEGQNMKWSLARLVCINPYDRQQMAGRVVRTYRYRVFSGTDGAPAVTVGLIDEGGT